MEGHALQTFAAKIGNAVRQFSADSSPVISETEKKESYLSLFLEAFVVSCPGLLAASSIEPILNTLMFGITSIGLRSEPLMFQWYWIKTLGKFPAVSTPTE